MVNDFAAQLKLLDMLLNMVPDNVVRVASSNANILSLMFFALIFCVGMVVSKASSGARAIKHAIEGLFQVSMSLMGLETRLWAYVGVDVDVDVGVGVLGLFLSQVVMTSLR